MLEPFSFSTKTYYQHTGMGTYTKLLLDLKNKLCYPDKQDLYTMSFKTASLDKIETALRTQIHFQEIMFDVFLNRRLAHAKFAMYSLRQKFWINFEKSLLQRFESGQTVFAFGSANIAPSQFKGSPSSPFSMVKSIMAKHYLCVLTPENYTSQKCCVCGHDLIKQKHKIRPFHKEHTARRISKKHQSFSVHGTLLCQNKTIHPKTITFSRDVNSAVNMDVILQHSIFNKQYTRPHYLTKATIH